MEEHYFMDGARLENARALRTLAFGEGVFETFRWRRAAPVFLPLHMDRMRRGAEFLGIPPPAKSLVRQRILEAAAMSVAGDLHMKVCLISGGDPVYYAHSRMSSLLVSARARAKIPEAVSLWICPDRKPLENRLYAHKTMNYLGNIVAKREALERGFEEALFLDSSGNVAETSCHNVFWIKGNRLYTPSLDCPTLPGVTRSVVLKLGPQLGFELVCGRFPLAKLLSSDCVFLTNAVAGMIRVNAVGGEERSAAHESYSRIQKALIRELGWER